MKISYDTSTIKICNHGCRKRNNAAILEDKYKSNGGEKKQFRVSTQHYSFAVNAFVDLTKEYGQEEYDFSIRETQTYEIIEDVARLRSEIGILFLNDFNEAVINKILKSYDMRIGYITHRKGIISRLGNSYLEALMKYI